MKRFIILFWTLIFLSCNFATEAASIEDDNIILSNDTKKTNVDMPTVLDSTNLNIMDSKARHFNQLVLKHPAFMVYSSITVIFILFTMLFIAYYSYFERKNHRLIASYDERLSKMLDELSMARFDRNAYKFISERDVLSGLLNKSTVESICREKSQKNNFTGAFIIIDLDHFKEANDTYGHQYGDNIIRRFSRALRANSRDSDVVGRFGGDEFIMYLHNVTDRRVLTSIARRLNALAVTLGTTTNHITASLGIAIAPEHGTSYDEIFRAADHALYQVKANGRNGFAFYTPV